MSIFTICKTLICDELNLREDDTTRNQFRRYLMKRYQGILPHPDTFERSAYFFQSAAYLVCGKELVDEVLKLHIKQKDNKRLKRGKKSLDNAITLKRIVLNYEMKKLEDKWKKEDFKRINKYKKRI